MKDGSIYQVNTIEKPNQGEFKNGEINGKGILQCPNGNKYEG